MKQNRTMTWMATAVVAVLLAQAIPAGADEVTLGRERDGTTQWRTFDGAIAYLKNTSVIRHGVLRLSGGPRWYNQRILMAFDLSGLEDGNGDAVYSSIDSLTLRIYVTGGGYGGPENTTTVYSVSQEDGDWDFSSTSNQDLWETSYDPNALGSYEYPASSLDQIANEYIEIELDGNAVDLTTMVNNWRSGNNAGLLLTGYESSTYPDSTMQTSFAQTEQLLVEYTPIPEPATIAMLGLGGVAMLIRRRRNAA